MLRGFAASSSIGLSAAALIHADIRKPLLDDYYHRFLIH